VKAAYYERAGAARDVLSVGEMPDPVAGAGEVLVRVAVSSVHPSDVKLRAGGRPGVDGIGWPRIVPHSDGAGVIEAVGAGVDAGTVLVTGGAGAVSFYAIQMAKAAGARVLTTVSSAEKAEYARGAGADHTIDYRREDVAAAIMAATDGHGIDHAVDLEFGANIEALAQVIRPNGAIVAYGSAAVREPVLPFYTLMFKRVTLRTELVYLLPDAPRRVGEAYLDDALTRGTLEHSVAARMPLDEVAAAHELVESGDRRGCVLITL